MAYVENNLMSQEQILHKGDIHWFVFMPGFFCIGIGLTFLTDSNMAPLSGIFFIVAVALFIKAFIFKISTEVAVTSKRVIAKMGFIRRKTVELNHQKVESLNVDQSIAGRLFGFGTIIVNGTGGAHTPIPSISNPLVFRRKAMETIDATQDTFQPSAPAPSAKAPFQPENLGPAVTIPPIQTEPKKEPLRQDWFAIGKEHIKATEYTEAIAALSYAIKADPNNRDIYYARAVAYSKVADKTKSLDDIQTAARLGHPKAVEYLQKKSE